MMSFKLHTIKATDGKELVAYHWEKSAPKAVIQIAHGMSEYAARYNHFAEFLVANGFAVVAHDQRGHGKTAGTIEKVGHIADANGMDLLASDVKDVAQFVDENYAEVPVFLLGHSMGSFVSRKVAFIYPNLYKGYLFSATGAHPGIKGAAGVQVASFLSLFGKRNRSKLLTNLAFGDFNKKFKPNVNDKDWLSRDSKVGEEYMKDPFCMQIFSAQFYKDMVQMVLDVNNATLVRKGDLTKPIYLFSGTMDPVGEYGKGTKRVEELYKKEGAADITLKFYEGGRHEMLNETNKEEVYQNLLNWVNTKLV